MSVPVTLPYIIIYVVVAVIIVLTLLNFKTWRNDGTLIKVQKYRKMMPYLMPGRNESSVYYDYAIPAEPLLDYLERAKQKGDFDCDITHCLVAAAAIGFHENPKMNRFTVGRRYYQRDGVHITFSMKRKQLNRAAKVSINKIDVPASQSFGELTGRINEHIHHERSGEKTYTDKELDLFANIPRPILRFFTAFVRKADYYNLLPSSFIKGDAMYASMVIANLGSLNMSAAYHHLYEWGTCSLFLMVGKIEERAVVENGEIVVRKILPLRYNYDERIDDGLNARFGMDSIAKALSNPDEYLGCLADDGSDHRPFLPEEA